MGSASFRTGLQTKADIKSVYLTSSTHISPLTEAKNWEASALIPYLITPLAKR